MCAPLKEKFQRNLGFNITGDWLIVGKIFRVNVCHGFIDILYLEIIFLVNQWFEFVGQEVTFIVKLFSSFGEG